VESKFDEKTEVFGFDGKELWRARYGEAAEVMEFAKWIEDPLRMQAFAIAAAANPDLLSDRGPVTVDGGDRIANRRAYRLRIGDDKGPPLFMWVSLDVDGNLAQHQLLGFGTPPAPVGQGAQVEFGDHQAELGFSIPRQRTVVRDSRRGPELVITTQKLTLESSLTDGAFERPKNEKK
jgi:hypothetical protein